MRFWRRRPREDRVQGAVGFYVAALLSLLVSVDTSWRFFRDELHITDAWERGVMFAVLEAGLLACGYGMRANVVRHGSPGAPRLFAWALCAVSGYMAWQLSGLGEGIARVTLGPVLGLVMLHLALGIEVRARTHHTTTWSRVLGEVRERVLSRLGLADDARDALTRTRDRAADRAARLALTRHAPMRTARLRRAIRASGVAHDPDRRHRLLDELATLRHALALADLPQDSPWSSVPTASRHDLSASVTEPLQTFHGLGDHPAPKTRVVLSATGMAPDMALAVAPESGTQDHASTPGDHSSTGPQDHPVPGPSASASATSSAKRTGPSARPSARPGATASARPSATDADLIARIRDHERAHGQLSRRSAMNQFHIGASRASALLTAARNGQVTS